MKVSATLRVHPTPNTRPPSLQDPTAKMSKSDPDPNAAVSIIEDADSIMRKFKRAVTDCDSVVEFREDKPAISNLLTIFSAMTERSVESLVNEYHDLGYRRFKHDLGEAVVERFAPVRERYLKLMNDKGYLSEVARQGAERAGRMAYKTVAKVKRKIGLVQP